MYRIDYEKHSDGMSHFFESEVEKEALDKYDELVKENHWDFIELTKILKTYTKV